MIRLFVHHCGTLLLGVLLVGWAAPAAGQIGPQINETPSAPGPGIVLGRTVDAATLAPLPRVQIRIESLRRTVLSDTNGVFTLRGLAAGDHAIFVSRLGYRSVAAVWRVGAQGLELEVPLEVQPLVLETLRVQARIFERRLRSSGSSVRGFGVEELARSAMPDARAFARSRAGLIGVSCGRQAGPGDGPQDCVIVRGGPVRPCIVIDERPAFGGWAELETYRPQELYRIDVIGGGRAIHVYSREYVRQMTRRKRSPTPADVLSMIACGS